jgi:hypothetical protein
MHIKFQLKDTKVDEGIMKQIKDGDSIRLKCRFAPHVCKHVLMGLRCDESGYALEDETACKKCVDEKLKDDGIAEAAASYYCSGEMLSSYCKGDKPSSTPWKGPYFTEMEGTWPDIQQVNFPPVNFTNTDVEDRGMVWVSMDIWVNDTPVSTPYTFPITIHTEHVPPGLLLGRHTQHYSEDKMDFFYHNPRVDEPAKWEVPEATIYAWKRLIYEPQAKVRARAAALEAGRVLMIQKKLAITKVTIRNYDIPEDVCKLIIQNLDTILLKSELEGSEMKELWERADHVGVDRVLSREAGPPHLIRLILAASVS